MLKQRGRAIDAGLRIVDVATLVVAFPIAYNARTLFSSRYAELLPLTKYWPLLAVTVLCWLLTAGMVELYQAYRIRPMSTELARIAKAIAFCAVGVGALSFFAREQQLSRLFVGMYFATSLAFMIAGRVLLREFSHAARRRGYNVRHVAVVGSGESARSIVELMREHPEWGWKFAGFVLEESAVANPRHGRILGWLDELPAILEKNVLDEVIFAAGREHLEGVECAVAQCQEQGVAARVCVDFFDRRAARTSLEELGDVPTVAFTTVPVDPFALFAKRVFDVLSSAAAILILAPVFIGVAIAIRLESPGPVLFRQRRVGVNGREFTLLKFRSMRTDAEAQLAKLKQFNEAGGPVFKMRNDPRVTRVGKFIRSTSIDELPQLFNVLKGEMSVVGPRPPIPSEVKQYKRWQRRRLSIKPGITCTWQVSGRSDISFEQWMQLDLSYIDNWSFWRDVKICFKTIPAVITGRGAR